MLHAIEIALLFIILSIFAAISVWAIVVFGMGSALLIFVMGLVTMGAVVELDTVSYQ